MMTEPITDERLAEIEAEDAAIAAMPIGHARNLAANDQTVEHSEAWPALLARLRKAEAERDNLAGALKALKADTHTMVTLAAEEGRRQAEEECAALRNNKVAGVVGIMRERDRYREALDWYADWRNWMVNPNVVTGDMEPAARRDMGSVARAAIGMTPLDEHRAEMAARAALKETGHDS